MDLFLTASEINNSARLHKKYIYHKGYKFESKQIGGLRQYFITDIKYNSATWTSIY